MEVKEKRILITNAKAIRLVRERAVREHRSKSNAAAATIIERLAGDAENENKNQKNQKASRDKKAST